VKRPKLTELPEYALVAIIVVVALVVGGAGYMLLVKPEKAHVASIRKDIAEKEATIAQYKAESATQSGAPKIRIADVYRLAQAMPAQLDMPDVLLELDQVARDAGITINSIAPQAPVSMGTYQVVPIALQFAGDYYSVTDLLYRLRTLVSVRHGQLLANGRLYGVDAVSLQPDGSTLRATVTVNTFIYGAGGLAVAAPAPTPTDASATDSTSTSTDTTSTDTTTTTTTTGAP
jgi:Tfp pilus assembly protein PilO